ncbi:DNA-binding response regulator [Spirochaetia bacterium]|nr:DNA-binding response regulator [Spirochaetia bacterium]
MIQIVIIDSQKEGQEYLRAYLSSQNDFNIVGIGSSGYEAIRLVETHKPDIVLMDNLPLGSGVKTASLIKSRSPGTSIILNGKERRIFTGFFNGISGYVTTSNPELLYHAIRAVYHGGCLIAPESAAGFYHIAAKLTGIVLKSRGEHRTASFNAVVVGKNSPEEIKLEKPKSVTLPATISSSEMQIMGFVGQGYTNKEIAKKLYLTEGTIRNYISAVLHKTGLHDRTQVAIYAIKAGL